MFRCIATTIALLLAADLAVAGNLSVDGRSVEYYPTESAHGDAEFTFDLEGFRNTYLLDCKGRRFLWVRNVDLATGQVTDNTWGATWKALNEKSRISNAVHDRVCEGTTDARPSGPASAPSPAAFSGRRGDWSWAGPYAFTDLPRGLSVSVAFPPETFCDIAHFALLGNDEIDTITFIIDDHVFRPAETTTVVTRDGIPVSGFPLSQSALKDLKGGRFLLLRTDEGDALASLSGSAAAFNAAYGHCVAQLGAQTLQASRNPVPAPGPDQPPPTPKVTVAEGGRRITFSGPFEEGDADRIRRQMREHQAKTLVLDSSGGLITEAKDLGFFLRSNRLATHVDGLCASACVFAFAAGVERSAGETAKIGVHRSSLPEDPGDIELGQEIAAQHYQYLKTMGVDPEIFAIASLVPSDEIRWLTRAELRELDLVNSP